MAANDVNSNDVSGDCGRLYLAALKGDWKSIEDMTNIQRRLNWNEETTLHIAAAAGNVKIAEMMLKKNPELPNLGVALQMLDKNPDLTTATNSDGKTALHVLAHKPSVFVNESQLGVLRRHINIPWLKSKQANSKYSQVNELLKKCLQGYRGDVENSNETSVISSVLFEAAEVGNIEFLVKLICFNFDLLWKIKDNKSIFHIAVEKRHESIFKLLNEIGSIGDLIVGRKFEDGSNILHLAARLAPQDKLNAISGAALQMQLELLWFKFQPQHLLLKAPLCSGNPTPAT
ncbi:uncharacterized protein LOC115976893 isoform X3 [Quercus lobata]|uniref:uncharacterized protein LOC115976893 isoform X3 n=1 Tax=Quercus lobata TaxID=97700 RepID=UPI001245AD10|nr:uncharacterized protein LOC115976893 isoform X3 [Quercus lobata]